MVHSSPQLNPIEKTILYSICISTYERPTFISRLTTHLLRTLRNNTEIVIVDDHSTDKMKLSELELLKTIHPNVRVFIHDENLGPFFAKLHSFQYAIGDYVMSIDDDDRCEVGYHNEIIDHIDQQFDFIINAKTPSQSFDKIKLDIESWIIGVPNHVYMAIRRSLFDRVEWPTPPLRILRDDSPLVIPLYMQSSKSRLMYFENKLNYILHPHQSVGYFFHQSMNFDDVDSRQFLLNGFRFVVREAQRIGKFDQYIQAIKRAYQSHLWYPTDEQWDSYIHSEYSH